MLLLLTPRLVNFGPDASQSETREKNLTHLNLEFLSLIKGPTYTYERNSVQFLVEKRNKTGKHTYIL